jgi:hypothetical protein
LICNDDKLIVVFRDAERERPGVWSVVIHFCVVLWFVVEGKISVEGLSETIKAARMRESGKEGRECGEVIKARMRGD